ncbi:acylphosphatase [Chloroflexota bacterium]
MMANLASVRVMVHGLVQGVFFRAFVSRKAEELGVTGYVRNLPTGEAVEVYAEGDSKQLEELISYLRVGPSAAKVAEVIADWSGYTGGYSSFSIRH